jgi:hypothetical protein
MVRLIRGFAVLCIAGFAVLSGTLGGQSREVFKKKYGEPVSETFLVRPDIAVTATYAKDGRIIELLVAPRTAGLIKSRGTTLSRDAVTAILDELVPLSERGKHLISGFENVACPPENDCWGTSQTYEKVAVYYDTAPEGRLHYAVVQWKE